MQKYVSNIFKINCVTEVICTFALYQNINNHSMCAGELFIVCRGTWFYEGAWTPLDEVLAEKLETEHLTHFRGHPLNVLASADVQKQGALSFNYPYSLYCENGYSYC